MRYVPTIFDRLDAARLPWKIYGTTKPKPGTWDQSAITAGRSARRWRTACTPGRTRTWWPPHSSSPDAKAGRLPAYSVVVPGNGTEPVQPAQPHVHGRGGQLDRPGRQRGHERPEWQSTALFITYDDCGCFYDHVPPGMNPDGTPQGPRMPLVIVSPYAKPGYTDTTPPRSPAILAFTEHTFGLAPLDPNDRGAYDFSHVFNYAQAPLRPAHMVMTPLPPWARHVHLTPAMLNDPT